MLGSTDRCGVSCLPRSISVRWSCRAARRGTGINAAYEWANEFDVKVQELVKAGGLDALVAFQQWGPMAPLAHPTHEHYLPLLYAAGAALPTEMPRFFNTGFQSASISMRSMLWG